MAKQTRAQFLPLVSAIVLNYNAKEFLEKSISSIQRSNYNNLEIVIVDNASTDGSTQVLQRISVCDKRIKLLLLSHNYGFSVGNNIGAQHAKGKYLVFLNPDTEVQPDWLTSAITAFEKDESIGAAQPKLLKSEGKIDSAGGFMTTYGLAWCRDEGKSDVRQCDGFDEIFFAKGAALIVRSNLFTRIGGFDPLFFTYWEETDLCWRIWMTGHKVVYMPKPVVYHVGAAVLTKHKYHTKYHEARGRLAMLIKNHSLRNVFWAPSLALCLYGPNILRHLARGDKYAAIAIAKGSVWWIFNLKRIWKSRLRQKALGLCFLERIPVEEKLPCGYLRF